MKIRSLIPILAPLALPEAREHRRLSSRPTFPPSSFPRRRRRAKPWWRRRRRTAFSRALGGGFGAPSRRRCGSVGDGLARWLGPASRWISVRWRSHWPRATWWRGWPAAPVGPDLGPFGPHLGRGGQAGLRAATKFPGGGEVRWQTGGGGVKAGLVQRGGGVFVGLFGPSWASVGVV
jgi:hypothetical protein